MNNQKNKVKVSELKGRKLYNFLVKELGEANKKLPDQQRMGIARRRKIVSTEIFPKLKTKDTQSIRDIRSEIKKIVSALPPKEICNPLYLSEAYLSFIEYYEIDNHIRNVLPDCLDIRINAGIYGKTKLFNTANYTYSGSGVQDIVESIRENLEDLPSGQNPYFSGTVKLKNKKKNDGNPDNYFVDYILYENDIPTSDDNSVSFELPNKELKKVEKINDYLASKFKQLQKEKRKKKRIAKKSIPKKPSEQKKETDAAVRNAIKSLKELVKRKLLTNAQFEKQKTIILSSKNKK
jgi:hypothetical protein